MPEKNFTMQSDKSDEALATPFLEKMTFAKNQNFVPYQDQSVDPLEFCSTTIKLEDINLEDEIEKVEATSDEEGSSSNSDEKLSDVSINQFAIPLFSEIPENSPTESVKNWLKQISEAQNGLQKRNFAALGLQTVGNAPSRVVKYEDLPYMGEITLNNSKPRRGRKPKKADICHLIYKNYGTIFPGTPNANNYVNGGLKKDVDVGKSGQKKIGKHSEKNRLISSLLEKRLTQDCSRTPAAEGAKPTPTEPTTSEPLNLCVRDHNPLKIRLLKNKNDNTYTSEIKSEPHSDDDVEIVPVSIPSSCMELKIEPILLPATPDSVSTSSTEASTPEGMATGPGGFVYWPNSGVYVHPMALQQQLMMYQRLAASNPNFVLPSHSPRPPPTIEPPPNEVHTMEPPRKPEVHKKHEVRREKTEPFNVKEKTKRNNSSCNSGSSSDKGPAKRKRSAIFIPPIPAENSTNPATEVSICKFKFTGGAKPSLQEKKMLSVDSGGNFRYYSGTGDKSMRGYEFFPREQLQQQVSNSQGSSTGAFLQASGEKIYPVPPVELTGGSATSDFLLNSDLSQIAAANTTSGQEGSSSTSKKNKKDKKRKSRKSLQREKLEKTFKEKGFLIQTQQLESSEGATYCKFRQLKKFTRYLFRSWKDYLPGELQGQQGQQFQQGHENGGAEGAVPSDIPIIDSTVDSNNLSPSEMPSSSNNTTSL